MNLTLELVSRDGQHPVGEPRKMFGIEGGRIGRASDCEWVLPSPYISRYHASICFTDGAFYVVSTGENGVALNATQAFLPQLEHRELHDGDRLFIDEFEIKVALAAAPEPPRLFEPQAVSFAAPKPSLRTEFGLNRSNDLLPTAPVAAAGEQRSEVAWNHSSGLADHFAPPVVSPASAGLPADWDTVDPSQQSSHVEPDLLRLLLQGLIDTLRTRADFHGQLRLPQARVRMSENNPLRFAINADEALAMLLRKPDERYLGALEAVREAFDDLRAHQVAISVGMRAFAEAYQRHLEAS